ncbi:hypothetical protein J3R82DRAFT_5209 [Butyriboletus roseoflavus]|nr:hypothetical protein J3R82DRAFT_5209 [Butyriboletus roseoflavus]
MTLRFLITKKDPRRADFILVRDPNAHADSHGITANPPAYTSDTTHYSNGNRATTTITRTDPTGDRFQVGVIEWPVRPNNSVQLVVGTRDVQMVKSGLYTSPEHFIAADGYVYEWQIQDGRPQVRSTRFSAKVPHTNSNTVLKLVPLRTHKPTSNAYVATFLQSRSGFWLRRKRTSSLFISPEGFHILDDIIVTFIYFESKWQDRENTKSHSSLSGAL